MNVLALNGSPRGTKSGTYRILEALLRGMESGGASTSLIHIQQLQLKQCTGCYSCWVHTPGECVHDDAMQEAIEAYNRADLVVFGTPVYHCSMTGLMKNFLDRLLPRYEPWLIPHRHALGMTGHPERWSGPDSMVLVSTCGFPELETFDALLATFRQIARMHGLAFLGSILRTYAEPLTIKALQPLFTRYFECLHEAGRTLMERGCIPEPLQQEMQKDLVPGDKRRLYELANDHWRRQIARRQRGLSDRP